MIRKQIAGLLVVTALIAGSASIYKDSRPPQSEDGADIIRDRRNRAVHECICR